MEKARFTVDGAGRVTARFTDPLGQERTETYSCNDAGGYVRDAEWRQVCEALAEYQGGLTLGSEALGEERLHARSKSELIKKAIRRVEKVNKG